MVNADFWKGRRVLVTGHTGFKGGWLSFLLAENGASVSGLALSPSTSPSFFVCTGLDRFVNHRLGDVRDPAAVLNAFEAARPDVVFHLAAQPLVRASYADPVETYATNVMGTVHVLEAARRFRPKAVIVVTSDKCYENNEWPWGYRENDRLGGYDPYSSSKACAEIATSAFRRSFFSSDGSTRIATARAGNVFGGGDWSPDRLVPDVIRSFEAGRPVVLRHPEAVRPWQHVLEPLSGYVRLAEALCGDAAFADAWNFGPAHSDMLTVSRLVDLFSKAWGAPQSWKAETASSAGPHEAHVLTLDCAKASSVLGWRPQWTAETGVDLTVAWHRALSEGRDMAAETRRQIALHTGSAKEGICH